MKIYLDDTRPCPQGWILVMSAEVAIDMLKQGSVDTISLDHDLGENKKTGYDVLLWIEKEVATMRFVPPKMIIHTQNPVGRKNMEAALKNIQRLQKN